MEKQMNDLTNARIVEALENGIPLRGLRRWMYRVGFAQKPYWVQVSLWAGGPKRVRVWRLMGHGKAKTLRNGLVGLKARHLRTVLCVHEATATLVLVPRDWTKADARQIADLG